MKKKLKLNDLSIKSFVTEVSGENLKGGTGDTMYSCLAYVTCHVVACYVTSKAPQCVTRDIQIQG